MTTGGRVIGGVVTGVGTTALPNFNLSGNFDLVGTLSYRKIAIDRKGIFFPQIEIKDRWTEQSKLCLTAF